MSRIFFNNLKYISNFSLHSLVVESAAIKEDGVYTLTASNNVGETVATATLNVHGRSSRIKKAYQKSSKRNLLLSDC